MNNILHAPMEDRLSSEVTDSSRIMTLSRLETKGDVMDVGCFVHVLQCGKQVMETCAGTQATAKARLPVSEYTGFIGFHKDLTCFRMFLRWHGYFTKGWLRVRSPT